MSFDKGKAAAWIRTNALPPFGNRKCATHVRQALEAGGLNTSGHPVLAKDWGPLLNRLGFRTLTEAAYAPDMGDVIVIQGTSASTSGHIELFDGKHWVSDFIQVEMWPGPSYRNEKPSYRVYRF